MLTPELIQSAQHLASVLRDRGETVAVAEGSSGGLVSAALLSIPGASAYFVGGTVKVGSTWGIGEAGAAGPANPYGDPAGHSWLAVDGPRSATRNVLTGLDDRLDNMVAFTAAALQLFTEVLEAGSD